MVAYLSNNDYIRAFNYAKIQNITLFNQKTVVLIFS